MEQLQALGTGYAIATKCYTTCFSLSDGEEHFLIDTGGGNGLLTQLERANIAVNQIHHVFLSHKHTDHIMGAVWLIRMVGHGLKRGNYKDRLTIYAESQLLEGLRNMCTFMLPKGLLGYFDQQIIFQPITNGLTYNILGRQTTFFDTGSQKDTQYGCRITLLNGKTLTFLGDEPYQKPSTAYAQGVDYLIHEAMCLYSDVNRYNPYGIHHSTVKEACENAIQLGAKALIMHHTEDDQLSIRKQRYTDEAKTFFSGQVYCPDDLDRIIL